MPDPTPRAVSSRIRAGSLWGVADDFRLPDGSRWRGRAPSLACLVTVRAEAGLAVAAPVLPGTALATFWDFILRPEGPPGFASRVVLPAAREIPLAALTRAHGRIELPAELPAQSADAPKLDLEMPPPWPADRRGLQAPTPAYLDEVAELGREWRYLERAGARLERWWRQGRVVRLLRPAAAPDVAAIPLAAGTFCPTWEDVPDQADLDGGRCTVAVCRLGQRWVLEVDLASGTKLDELWVDGAPRDVPAGRPARVELPPEGSPCWLCLRLGRKCWLVQVDALDAEAVP